MSTCVWAVAVCAARSAEKKIPVILRAVKSTLRISKVVKCSGQIPAVKCGQIFPPNKNRLPGYEADVHRVGNWASSVPLVVPAGAGRPT